ncbi:MAG: zinc ribbon domain-containing protein [Oscillospiraceae bacterium]|nr:zinc ribbon domain-containing protein [Oscillospiraceae bacterium]
MIEVCVPHMKMPEDAARDFLRKQLPTLKHWKNKGDWGAGIRAYLKKPRARLFGAFSAALR